MVVDGECENELSRWQGLMIWELALQFGQNEQSRRSWGLSCGTHHLERTHYTSVHLFNPWKKLKYQICSKAQLQCEFFQ